MVDDATLDCYNDSERVCGLFTKLEDELALPFTTTVLGVAVTVARIELARDDRIVAICAREGVRQRIPLLDLPLPTPPPDGADWIAAYRRWAGQSGTA